MELNKNRILMILLYIISDTTGFRIVATVEKEN